MSVFPVSSSIITVEAVAAFVKDTYELAGLVTARILKTGISHTYLITNDASKYVFRIYSFNWRTEEEIKEEIRLLHLLKENTIPVSYAIADAKSNYIQYLHAPEGQRFGVLFSFATGEKMLNFPPALHFGLGQIMANFHKVTNNIQLERIAYTPEVLLVSSFEKLKQFLPPATDEMQYMQSLQTSLLEIFAGAQTGDLRKGIVHLDIWFDNLVIDQKNEITLFDFDFCGNGWPLLDLAYTILQIYSTEKDENEFKLKKENFLKGYESVTIISEEEKRLIPAAAASIYFFYLGIQCSRYDDWANTFLNEIYLKRFINLLIRKWVNFNELPVA